DGADI
ncbi:hypothetical protein EC960932_1300, partial [Escherichia coli 96.0932]